MCDDWMSGLRLPLTGEQFQQLPRNPAYRYEFVEGAAHLSPRPRYYHALLDLTSVPGLDGDERTLIRPVREADWELLPEVFAAAFHHLPPLGHLEDEARLAAARKCLTFTRQGGDGPLIDRASLVAAAPEDARPRGAIVVTLLPDRDPSEPGSFHWDGPPPAAALARRLGRPHLTWIFVDVLAAGAGLGTALLHAAAGELRRLGFTELASTFMLGNHSSMLWHWRAGFRLAAHPFSRRRSKEPLSGSSW
jgi:GNAT superfamily N-acetyltransferase